MSQNQTTITTSSVSKIAIVTLALIFGFGLFVVGFSTPYLIADHLGGETIHFVYCQIVWVGLYLLAANCTGMVTKWLSPDRLIGVCTWAQVVSALLFLSYTVLAPTLSWQGLLLSLIPYCIAMGLRGGVGFSQAVLAVPSFETRASALMIFFSMGLTSLSVALSALYLDQGLITIVLAQLFLILASWGMLRFIRPSPTT